MKTIKSFFVISIIFLGVINLCAKDYNKEFKVKPGQKLYLDLETGTEIEIAGWDKDVVHIDLKVSGRDSDLFEIEVEQTSNGIDVITEYGYNKKRLDCDSRITVNVPKIFNIDFNTRGGDVKIVHVEGSIDGETMGGELNFSELKGELNCQTMGGSIIVMDSDVDGQVKTMGGKVHLENLTGDINASTMGGSVVQKNVKGRSGKNGKELNVSTMGGPIDIDNAPNGAKVKTMGGGINVESVGNFLDAETMGGDITVKKLDGWIKASTMGGDIEVIMVGDPQSGKRDVFLKSMGGDIELTVPEELSMDIDVEIKWTKRNRQPQIEGDFDIEEKISDDWENDNGDRDKLIKGTKSVKGGKNEIKIRTINGNVRINKG